MKQMRRAIRVITALIVVSFLALGGWLGYTCLFAGLLLDHEPAQQPAGRGQEDQRHGRHHRSQRRRAGHHAGGRNPKYNSNKTLRRAVSPDRGRRHGHVGNRGGDIPRGRAAGAVRIDHRPHLAGHERRAGPRRRHAADASIRICAPTSPNSSPRRSRAPWRCSTTKPARFWRWCQSPTTTPPR